MCKRLCFKRCGYGLEKWLFLFFVCVGICGIVVCGFWCVCDFVGVGVDYVGVYVLGWVYWLELGGVV